MSEQKKKMFKVAVLGRDKGGEFLAYNSVFGLIKDYSPWTIKEYKTFVAELSFWR